jgi:ectoine hydroxylase-related dioxygenase (phytanoyl-CoA dioxygenase family)
MLPEPPGAYGAQLSAREATPDARHLEEVRIVGYAVLPSVLSPAGIEEARRRLDAVYEAQEQEFGRQRLEAIQELDTARCPLVQDEFFLRLAADERVLAVVRQLLGDYVVLHLQNGILNRSDQRHNQASWHRDLPYQSFVSSKPLAVSAFWCLDPFNEETGGTCLLPASHRIADLPSSEFVEEHAVQISAEPGSVLIFDAMTFHRAGRNRSGRVRRGVNHVYTVPILQQQLRLPALLAGRYSGDERYRRLLGYDSEPAASVREYRERRLERLQAHR